VNKTFKSLAIAFLFIIVVVGVCVFSFAPRPPKEAKLIQHFSEHRGAFEQLRDMLQADTNLSRVASWGVETRQPQFLGYPTEQNFPTKRFQQYIALLQQANGYGGVRFEGDQAGVGIIVWGSGFAGDTRHVWISWMNEAPNNQGGWVYKKIDQNWYLQTDW